MVLYHGSNIANIKVLRPNQADHDRPYVYMTTIDVVAAFYLCNAVERPYYWFPYGFEGGSNIPVYHELYPNALKEVSEGVSGYIYEVIAEENQIIPFKNIPCARLATEPIEVMKCTKVENAYALFMEYVKQGKMKISHFEDKSDQQLVWWYSCCADYLKEKGLSKEGIWLLFGKAGGSETIKAGEALEEALCFGWIDGQMQRIDDRTYKKYFSMRRENSKWSEKNKELVKRLEERGLMTDFGRKKIEEAKKMGSGTHRNPCRLQRSRLLLCPNCWNAMSRRFQILAQCPDRL